MKNNLFYSKSIGLFFAIITIFIWGITFVSTKYLLKNFSALEILFVRFILACLGLWIIKPIFFKLENVKDNFWFIVAGISGIVLYQFTENSAISFTTASNVSIIVSICPMWTAIIAQFFLREKHITFFFIIGFIIAITGVFFVSMNGSSQMHFNPKGDLLALCAAICWGFYSLSVSKINGMKLDKILCIRRVFFFAIIFMIPFIVYGIIKNDSTSSFYFDVNIERNIKRFSLFYSWINFCFLGLGASAFCFVAWNVACNTLGTVKVTAGIYMIPVVTIVFAFFILGERLTERGLLGCLLTIIGLIISNKGKK